MFPWEGKSEFPDAVCYITEIFEQQQQGQTSTLILLDLSAATTPIGHGCLWYVCLCKVPQLHEWLAFFSSLKRPRWQCLVTTHMPRGVSPCMCHQTALFCHSSFSVRESNSKDCTILSRKENTAQPAWLTWLLGQWYQQKMWRGPAYWHQSCKFQPRICGDATIIQTHNIARDHCMIAVTGDTTESLIWAQAGRSAPFFLMEKGSKWRNL